MSDRSRVEELAKRVEDLLRDIRAEIDEASLTPRHVGVLTYLEEAASLLNHAGLRMGWWLHEEKPRSVRPAESDARERLAGEDLYAAVRYVTAEAPALAPALVWAIGSAPELVSAVKSAPPASGDLAALATLDEALAEIVSASPAGFRLSGRVWQRAKSSTGADRLEAKATGGGSAVTAAGVARIVRDVSQTRPDLLPACLWLLVRRPATRLAVGAYSPTPEELAELGELAKP